MALHTIASAIESGIYGTELAAQMLTSGLDSPLGMATKQPGLLHTNLE